MRQQDSDIIGDKGITFDQALALYISDKKEPLKIAQLMKELDGVPVKEIDKTKMRYLTNRIFPEAKPATIRRHLYTPVKAIINLAAEDGLCDRVSFKAPTGDTARTYFFRPTQADAIINSLHLPEREGGVGNPHLPALVTFLIGQGVRPSEAFTLKASDTSLDDKQAILRDTKTGGERSITLIPRVVAALSTLDTINGDGPIFRRRDGEPFTVREDGGGGQIQRDFSKALERAGLDTTSYSVYCCRHTWATWFYSQTKDVLRLQNEGGWSPNSSQWKRYVKLASPSLGKTAKQHGWDFTDLDTEEFVTDLPPIPLKWGKIGGDWT